MMFKKKAKGFKFLLCEYKIGDQMQITAWDNTFFRLAMEKCERAEELEAGEEGGGCMASLAARCYFFCDLIASILYIPLAIGVTLYALVKSVVRWKKADELSYLSKLGEKLNHIALDLVGMSISPTIARDNRYENWGVFVAAGCVLTTVTVLNLSSCLYSPVTLRSWALV
jgi:hypothetical protein